MSEFRSPYPYFGGKSSIAAEVWSRLGKDVTNFVDLFFGSNAVLLARPGWSLDVPWIETINDASGFVANFWRAVQHDPDAVASYADWPSNENDLHARHSWLVRNHKESLPALLEGDPDYYDAKVAGWWVWGMACWIGGGFCSGNGSWNVDTDEDGFPRLVKSDYGDGIKRQLVHLGNAGQGVQRRRVHLGNAGQGVQRKLVHLGGAFGSGSRGIMADRVMCAKGNNAGTGERGLYAWMQALQDRMHRVRVCCGDWSRVVTPAVTTTHGLTAAFLDPPYSAEAGRDNTLYEVENPTVAHDARRWALEHGDDPMFRLALCGYEGEHDMPKSWEVLHWTANGGMANQGNGRGLNNRHREVIYFSPHCLKPEAEFIQFDMFGG